MASTTPGHHRPLTGTKYCSVTEARVYDAHRAVQQTILRDHRQKNRQNRTITCVKELQATIIYINFFSQICRYNKEKKKVYTTQYHTVV